MQRTMIVFALGLAAFGCKRDASTPASTVQNSTAFDAAMTALLPHYLAVQEALAADNTNGVAAAAEALAGALTNLDVAAVTGPGATSYAAIKNEGPAAAKRLAATTDVAAARGEFKAISKLFAPWAANARPTGVDLVWCEMAPGGWLQKSGPVRNPYYGASMLECGEKQPATAAK